MYLIKYKRKPMLHPRSPEASEVTKLALIAVENMTTQPEQILENSLVKQFADMDQAAHCR